MAENNKIGFCVIQSAILEDFNGTKQQDIGNLIIDIEYSESMNQFAINGQITIVDSLNLFNRFPLLGEEFLTLSIEDFFGEVYEQKFWCYEVNQLSPSKDSATLSYVLSICSIEILHSESKKLRKSYKGTPTSIAGQIWQQCFPDTNKQFILEPTDNTQTLIIPGITPLQAINFVARRAYKIDSLSNDFYFFENRLGYHFTSYENLIENPIGELITLTYDSSILHDSTDAVRHMHNINAISFPNTVNSISDISSGSLISRVTELDIIHHTFTQKIFELNTNFPEWMKLDDNQRLPHTQEFLDTYSNDESIVKDFLFVIDQSRKNQKYKEIALPKNVNRHRLNSQTAMVKIYGRNTFYAGQIIDLAVAEFEIPGQTKDVNRALSGNYIIHDITHKISLDKPYFTTMTLIKNAPKGRSVDLKGDSISV